MPLNNPENNTGYKNTVASSIPGFKDTVPLLHSHQTFCFQRSTSSLRSQRLTYFCMCVTAERTEQLANSSYLDCSHCRLTRIFSCISSSQEEEHLAPRSQAQSQLLLSCTVNRCFCASRTDSNSFLMTVLPLVPYMFCLVNLWE